MAPKAAPKARGQNSDARRDGYTNSGDASGSRTRMLSPQAATQLRSAYGTATFAPWMARRSSGPPTYSPTLRPARTSNQATSAVPESSARATTASTAYPLGQLRTSSAWAVRRRLGERTTIPT